MRFRAIPFNGTAGIVHACRKGLNESHLRSAICFEVQNGCHNPYYRCVRFKNFLQSKLYQRCSRSNQFSDAKLLKESSEYNSGNISERSKLLNKVSVLMGYSSIQDLIEQEKIQKEINGDTDGKMEDYDFTLARSRFPCITLGESSVIELYNEVPPNHERVNPLLPGSCNTYLPFSLDDNWTEANRIGEALQLMGSPISIITSPASEGMLLSDLRAEKLGSEMESDIQVSSNKFSAAECINSLKVVQINSQKSSAAECIDSLDASRATQLFSGQTVRDLPNTTSRQCRQLEDSGLYTVRKLLHHFARTYADLQNVQGAIEDGYYLICVGTVLSSRGIRANSSFSFLEVVVACEVPNKELTSEFNGEQCAAGKRKMIYLHLKKFFRGTRFTYQPFLISLQSKYKEGDRAYVSGKVKKMRAVDHFEIRECSIDKLEEEEEQHADLEKRPYPLYPSKVGLKPSFLRDIVLRVRSCSRSTTKLVQSSRRRGNNPSEISESSGSVDPNGQVLCYCCLPAPMLVASTEENAGRKFYACYHFPRKCKFFVWRDLETRPGVVQYLQQLHRENEALQGRVAQLEQDLRIGRVENANAVVGGVGLGAEQRMTLRIVSILVVCLCFFICWSC